MLAFGKLSQRLLSSFQPSDARPRRSPFEKPAFFGFCQTLKNAASGLSKAVCGATVSASHDQYAVPCFAQIAASALSAGVSLYNPTVRTLIATKGAEICTQSLIQGG